MFRFPESFSIRGQFRFESYCFGEQHVVFFVDVLVQVPLELRQSVEHRAVGVAGPIRRLIAIGGVSIVARASPALSCSYSICRMGLATEPQ